MGLDDISGAAFALPPRQSVRKLAYLVAKAKVFQHLQSQVSMAVCWSSAVAETPVVDSDPCASLQMLWQDPPFPTPLASFSGPHSPW